VWSAVQKEGILGGKYRNYLDSLPFKNGEVLFADLIILLLSNHILWVFYIGGVFFLSNVPDQDLILSYLKYLFLIILLVNFQIAILYKSTSIIFRLIIIGLLLQINIGVQYLDYIFVTYLFFILIKCMQKIRKNSVFDYKKLSWINIKYKFTDINGLTLQYKHFSSAAFRLLLLIIISLFYFYSFSHFNEISSQQTQVHLLLFQNLIATISIGFAIYFRQSRVQFREILSSLPIPQISWWFYDLTPIVLLVLSINLILLAFGLPLDSFEKAYVFVYSNILLLGMYYVSNAWPNSKTIGVFLFGISVYIVVILIL